VDARALAHILDLLAEDKIAAVVGDGAVGLCGVIAARRLGAEQIIMLGRHTDRIALARRLGATDIVGCYIRVVNVPKTAEAESLDIPATNILARVIRRFAQPTATTTPSFRR
jgi:threonine dehydrogenase-like Zn-dependent dehydrogenase